MNEYHKNLIFCIVVMACSVPTFLILENAVLFGCFVVGLLVFLKVVDF